MVPAHVGFWCPDCVGQQRSSTTGSGARRTRVFTRQEITARWAGGGSLRRPLITLILLGINVAVFVLELLTGAVGLLGGGSSRMLYNLGALYLPSVLIDHEYWRMFTAAFLHGGLLHLLFNMWALWVLGEYLEAAVGRVRFLALYLLSAFAGSTLVLFAAPVNSLVVGASGAIFGLFGALAVHAYLNRNRDPQSRAILTNVAFVLVINLVFTFMGSMISWQAHVGGLIAGAVLMYALMLGGRRHLRDELGRADLVVLLFAAISLSALTYWHVATFALQ